MSIPLMADSAEANEETASAMRDRAVDVEVSLTGACGNGVLTVVVILAATKFRVDFTITMDLDTASFDEPPPLRSVSATVSLVTVDAVSVASDSPLTTSSEVGGKGKSGAGVVGPKSLLFSHIGPIQ